MKRVVIVTGAGSGLGRAYAMDLAARGLRVVVNNRRRQGIGVAYDNPAEVTPHALAADLERLLDRGEAREFADAMAAYVDLSESLKGQTPP